MHKPPPEYPFAGPFADMTDEEVADLDDFAYDARLDDYELPGAEFDLIENAA
jgi:hypothetical protein